jgi:heme-degrading monooxygenase HmoA
MPVVSITRLRVRSWKFMPGFAVYAVRSRMQASRAKGNCGMKLMREPGNVFWTATLWESDEAVKKFMVAHPHGEAMRRLLEWCDEASVARWSQDSAELPDWQEAHRRMQGEGRRSKVRFPSAAHERLEIPAPKKK